jgi:hypothetical protein
MAAKIRRIPRRNRDYSVETPAAHKSAQWLAGVAGFELAYS